MHTITRALLSCAFLVATPAMASSCPEELERHVNTIGADISQQLVSNDFLGGKDIEYEIDSCSYVENDKSFDIDLRIKWRGAILKFNEYEVWGRLLSNFDGTEATFTPVGANDKVQSLRFWGNVGSIGISIVQN